MRQTWRETRASQGLGGETLRPHTHTVRRPPTRYLVVTEAGGYTEACLLLAGREQVPVFDASIEETAQMTRRLAPAKGPDGSDSDRAPQGRARAERADIYTYTYTYTLAL